MHPLTGRKQSPEHIARRMAAVRQRLDQRETARFPSHDDVVYTAGLVDGEGWIGIIRQGPTKRQPSIPAAGYLYARVVIQMTDEAVIRWLGATWGGTCTGPYNFARRQPYWSWKAANRVIVESVLAQIQPYLKVKAAQAHNALALLREASSRASADYFDIQAQLNRRGLFEPPRLEIVGGA